MCFRRHLKSQYQLDQCSARGKNVESVELLCCSDVEVLVCKAIQKMFKCWCPKKNRRGLTQTESVREKFSKSQMSKLKNWRGQVQAKSKRKGASSVASVFKYFSTTGHGSAFDKRCSRCYTLRGCILADVQCREELKMLLQAKRQPGYKMPGRVVDRAYRFQMTRMLNWL